METKLRAYSLYKRSFGDFDIEQQDTICVSPDRELLVLRCIELNAKRTSEDLKREIEFIVSDKRNVQILGI